MATQENSPEMVRFVVRLLTYMKGRQFILYNVCPDVVSVPDFRFYWVIKLYVVLESLRRDVMA